VRVVYSDETGTGSDKEPFTVIVGVMFNMDSQWIPVSEQIGNIADLLSSQRTAEIKGRLLYKKLRSGRTEPYTTILARLHQIAPKNRLQIFTGIVNRKGMLRDIGRLMKMPTITDHSIAFGECLKAVDDYVATMLPKEKVLWISDKSGKEEPNLKDALEWQRLSRRIDLTKAVPELNLPEQPESDPSRIVDTVYFGDSIESRPLQLADVYCSTVALHIRNHAAARPYFQMIRPQIINFVGAL
jgi:hypothetical protein